VGIAGLSPGRVNCNRADLLLADGVSYDRFRQPDYKAFQPAVLLVAMSIARTQKLVAHPAMNAVFALKVFDQIIGGESMRIRLRGGLTGR
jgi:hypothetical protein